MLCNMSTENMKVYDIRNGRMSEDDGFVRTRDGSICIDISENASIMLNMSFDGDGAGSAVNVNIADGAEVYLIENYKYDGASNAAAFGENFMPCAVNINLSSGSTLKHQILFEDSRLAAAYTLNCDAEANAVYDNYQSNIGGKTKCNTEINLNGYGASVSSHLIAFCSGEDDQRYNIRINHHAKGTRSRMTNCGAAADVSKCIIDYVGVIDKGPSRSDAYQKSRIISLSPQVKAHVSPALLIDEYDVSAGHSGSVGGIDAEALYYMQSRGVRRQEAVAMFTAGFLMGAADKSNSELYEDIEHKVRERINRL